MPIDYKEIFTLATEVLESLDELDLEQFIVEFGTLTHITKLRRLE